MASFLIQTGSNFVHPAEQVLASPYKGDVLI